MAKEYKLPFTGAELEEILREIESGTPSDGVSPTVNVTETEGGYDVTITDVNGAHSFTLMHGKDGDAGSDATVTTANITKALGYAPAKQDDVTQLSEEIADQQTQIDSLIVQGVQQTPSYPQGDAVEEQLAWLADNGDTTEIYLLADGYLYAYKTVETAGGIEEVTEQITGEFTEDYRLSTSSGNLSQLEGAITTPLIDLTKYGDKVTIHLDGTGRDTVNWAATTAVTGNSIVLYNDGAFAWGGYTGTTTYAGVTYTIHDRHDVDVFIDRTKISCTHVRFSGVTGRADRVSVSVTYEKETTGGTETKWTSTGFTFTPADYESRIFKLETDTNNLKVRVNNLEDSILTGDTIPEYVLTEAEEVADKVLAVRNADSFVMSLASDLHTNGTDTSAVGVLHAGQAMDAINAITALDLVSLLGDYEVYDFSYGDGDTDGEDARKSHKYTNKVFSEIRKGVPFIKLKGNHDYDADDAETVEQQKTYAYIGANNIGTVTDYDNKAKVYGYRDFENYKIRVIYLNTSDGGSCSVSTEQLNWLNTVALNLTEGWLPVVLSHHPLNWDGMGSVLNALNTYKGTGKSIIHFHGHIHNFRAETLGTNNVLTVTIPNACFGRNNEYGTASSYSETIRTNFGDTDESGNQRQFNKTAGTAEDTAFKVVVVDRQNRKVHCFNYGAGVDRELSY